ncbi:MAG: nicotinate (nicotinamide) nucleotide adenylyltransferase [Terracidiphilus sp.]|jgi:nicotinate-nucleotide adenylyltransferase
MDQPAHRSRRVAFFGGSFDPPHLGHLAVARAARAALGLNAVLFAPVGAQPLKPHGSSASFADRLAMTQLAIAGEPGFTISFADAPRPSGAPNYTLETLLGLRAALPADGQLFCLMGADSFFSLRGWHRAAEIPFVAPLIVASRPGQQLEGLRVALPQGLAIESAPGAGETGSEVELLSYQLRNPAGAVTPFFLLPGLNVDVSATEIREQVRSASGSETAVHEVLPVAVSGYIRSHGLYR